MMKKKNLKTLKLNKAIISNLKKSQLKGGSSAIYYSNNPTDCIEGGASSMGMLCGIGCENTLPV